MSDDRGPLAAGLEPARYVVVTADGYVGRRTLASELTCDQPFAFASIFDAAEADLMAERFCGDVLAL